MKKGNDSLSSIEEYNNESKSWFIIRLNFVDIVTLLGVFLCCWSASFILKEQYEYALAVLYIAVIADAFDGVLARKFKLEREFGRYLDGFVDTLDYLIVPVMFLYIWGFNAWYQSLLLVLFIICGFIRLAVFNHTGNVKNHESKLSYLGAPVFWSALVLGPLYLLGVALGKETLFQLLHILIPIFCLAMLHNANYYKFKNPVFMLTALLLLSLFFFFRGVSNSAEYSFSIKDFVEQMILALFAILPIAIAGILHMVVVKKNFLASLNIPIHNNMFGQSKTWRGFLLMPLFSVIGFYFIQFLFSLLVPQVSLSLMNYSSLTLGLVIGLAYVIAELPNSAFKRYLGIAAGELPQKNRYLFVLIDQLDSIIGCCLAYYLFFNLSLSTVTYILLLAIIFAFVTKRLLFIFGYKKTAT